MDYAVVNADTDDKSTRAMAAQAGIAGVMPGRTRRLAGFTEER